MPHGDHAGHGPGHGHAHAHAPKSFGRAFAIGIGLNIAYVAAEAFYGIAAHSLALLADAGHNFGDVLGLAAAWGAAHLGTRAPSSRYTYGMRRSSILAALGNAVVLLVVTGGIAWEGVRRLFDPQPVAGVTVMVVAGMGIVVNGIAAWLFVAGRGGDMNIRGAFLHAASDALVSAGVVVAGLLILLTGWLWLDPAISLVVSGVIVAGTWSLLRESLALSLDGVPAGLDAAAVGKALRSLPGVSEVHDLHIWGMSTTETALTAHLVHAGPVPHDALLARACSEMRGKFGIGHATFQIETPEAAGACGLRPAGVV